MKKMFFLIAVILSACTSMQQNVEEQQEVLSPLQSYKKCMGHSDKSIVHTTENVGRYIVVISKQSETQAYLNKKEQGPVYSIGLLKCDKGNTVKECQDQMWLNYMRIGSPTKWKVGDIKIFTNADFVYDNLNGGHFTEILRDGRFASYSDYCYITRSNLTKTYCPNFIFNTEWHSECKLSVNIDENKQ